MDSRLRTNLGLVAVLVVAGLVIAYGPETEKEPQGVPLFNSGEKFSRIAVYENDDLRFALERAGEAWRLVAPVELPAARFHVDSLLDALHAPASRRYPLDETDPAALGLAAPEWRVEVDGQRLLLGDSTALGRQRYLQMGDHVYLVNEMLVYQLKRDPFDYADKRLLPLLSGALDIRSVELPSGQVIERAGNGWTVTPADGELSGDALQATVSAWENARALRVTPASSVPRDGEVTITFANGGMLRFGVEIRGDELLLSRAEPAVTYVLPITAAADLLQVTAGSPVEPAGE